MCIHQMFGGSGGQAGYVDVHGGFNLVDSLNQCVMLKSPGCGASPHGDHPFGLGHLL